MQMNPPQSHACFRLEIRFPLALPAGLALFDVWHGLSYRVIREPGDLLAHTRRVLLCRHPQLTEYLPGALHDLFEATDEAGVALKRRLLLSCQAELNESDRARLQARIDPDDSRAGEHSAQPAQLDLAPAGSVLPSMAQLLEAQPRTHDGSATSADNHPAAHSPAGLPSQPMS